MLWKFTPYNRDKWNNAEERILFVASEPNGDNPNSGKDMGEWFRTAKRENNYHDNPQFFTRCKFILDGINNKSTGNVFDNFRFIDLKATQGNQKADPNAVLKYVTDNLEDVIKYFDSTDPNFGLSPHIVVLLGNTTQSIFSSHIRHKLKNSNLKWIGMPHPSAQVGYVGLEYASKNIRMHLKPINELADKWIYQKNSFNVWTKI